MPSILERIYADLLDADFQQELFGGLEGFARKGTGYIARCPFHEDESSTLVISGHRPEYFCFVCSRRGDWISFLRAMEGMSFTEALERLARAARITPADCSEADWETELLFSLALETLMGTFITELWSKPGEEALHYLFSRGYATGEVEGMALGYYPGFDRAMEILSQQGLPPGQVESVRTRLWRDTGKAPGVAIPYRDASGRIFGLFFKDIRSEGPDSYRALTDPALVEHIPFLIHRARRQATIMVVEGMFDALLLDQVRLKPAIGIGAGGFTREKIEAAASFGACHFILALGNGRQRKESTRSAIDALRERRLKASVLPLPGKYHDIDAFIRMTCLDHFRALLRKTVPAETWLADIRHRDA
jgi:DNA primase